MENTQEMEQNVAGTDNVKDKTNVNASKDGMEKIVEMREIRLPVITLFEMILRYAVDMVIVRWMMFVHAKKGGEDNSVALIPIHLLVVDIILKTKEHVVDMENVYHKMTVNVMMDGM